MDPIAAIGFAASILQFIQFSTSLVRGAYEIQRSSTGTTSENAHIRDVISDLKEVTDGLGADFKGSNKHEKALLKLATQCHAVSDELMKILNKLKTNGDSKWESVKVKWMSIRKEKEVASIEKRLSAYSTELLLRLSFMMQGQQSTIKERLDNLQQEGVKLSSQSAEQISELRKELASSVEQLRAAPLQTADDAAVSQLLAGLRSIMAKIEIRARALPWENAVLRRLHFDTMYSREDNISVAESGTFKWMLGEQDLASSRPSISGSVASDSRSNGEDEDETIHDSRSEIEEPLSIPKGGEILSQSSPSNSETGEPFSPPEAEGNTGKGSPSASKDQVGKSTLVQAPGLDPSVELAMRQKVADSFLSFIEHDNGIFFISGKAGSGKSTLMKFLGGHNRVKALAESWAGEKTLVFAPFYFWNSGDRLQMSLEGFYRTVLFKVLQQCPEMAVRLFPPEFKTHNNNDNFSGPFRIVELRSAMETLTKTADFPSHRFCFFFDGMDEYEGDSLEHLHLARMFKSWASSSDIKIICAARPHEEFMKTFADAHVLVRLHELTRGDIHKFLISQLQKELIESGSEEKLNEYTSLVDEMVNMSDGVFLWAYLVMRSILSGIAHEDTTQILKERMQSTPRELNDLFKKILNSVDPALQGRSRNLLLLATNDTIFQNIPAIAYSWISDLYDDDFPFSSPMKPLSQEEVDKRLRIVRGQLSALTKGLLEMQSTGATDAYSKYAVGFLHRTVRDFLKNEHGWRRTALGEDLLETDQPELYLRLWVAVEKFSPSLKLYPNIYRPLWVQFNCRDYVIAPRILDAFGEIVDTVNEAFKAQLAVDPPTETTDDGVELHRGVAYKVIEASLHFRKEREGEMYRAAGFSYSKAEDISFIRSCLSYNQCSYVMSKLRSKSFLNEHRVQLPRFLLIKTSGLKPDLQFCKAMFDLGVIPDDKISLLQDQASAPIWLVFLRTFIYDIYAYSEKAVDVIATLWLILEEFLLRGADADVIFVLKEEEKKVLSTPIVAEAAVSPSIEGRTEISPPQSDQVSYYYLELEQLVDLLSPPNTDSLKTLLSKRPTTRLWNKASGFVSKFAPWGRPAPWSIGNKYLPMEIEWLNTRRWVAISVMTRANELAGNFEYDVF
ncbi:hypothetical protein N431DRAFT_416093 [Stipitochalara longipes BDJ]|nr:hypothetical protein N431DRAFT_416093 [Stipitochalara longipes BDJ]